MGLFDMFKKKTAETTPAAEPAKPARPAAVAAQEGTDALCAPVSGRVVAMADVPDPVFSAGTLGNGCAIWPEDETVYAPISGKVTVVMGHAVGIVGDSGIEALVHVGIDTVAMNGKGFTGYVAQGDTVRAGDPILGIDRAAIKEAGHPDCVVLVVSNTAEFADVTLTAEAESTVAAGAAVLQVTRA